MALSWDTRPVIVAIAGPNGAGKSTFYEVFLESSGLRFVNADVIAKELDIDAYEAARVAEVTRAELVAQGESFVFETVLSDPDGTKVDFLADAAAQGYTVLLCFLGLDSADTSDARVAMRVSQGGHDVPPDKIEARYPRTLCNLERALRRLPAVWVYDQSDLNHPFRKVAELEDGKVVRTFPPVPTWVPLPRY